MAMKHSVEVPGVFIGDRQVYFDTRVGKFLVYTSGTSQLDGATVNNLRESMAEREARLEEEREKRAKKKAVERGEITDVLPAEVSVLGYTANDYEGDYQLTGWHASQGTPLLIDSKDRRPTSTVVRNMIMVRRLTPEQWAEWRQVKKAALDARTAYDKMDYDHRIRSVYARIPPDGAQELLITKESGRDIAPFRTVPYRFANDFLVAEVDGQKIIQPSMNGLMNRVSLHAHPLYGQPVVQRSGKTWVEGVYDGLEKGWNCLHGVSLEKVLAAEEALVRTQAERQKVLRTFETVKR